MSWIPNSERRLIFTDLETTGDTPGHHEIIEVGAVLTEPDLTIIEELDVRVAPRYPERILKSAYERNGVDLRDWGNTHSPEEALSAYDRLGAGAVFVSHAMAFDWGFLESAYREEQQQPSLHYHRLDTLSMAWMLFGPQNVESFSLDALAKHLGIEPEPMPHRAINGARMVREVYAGMRQRAQ